MVESLTNSKTIIWKERFRFLLKISLKTIYFNFKYLPFKQAIHFPIIIAKKVKLKRLKGKIIIEDIVYFKQIEIGFNDVGIFDYNYSRTIWDVSGIVIFKGRARIGHGSKIAVGENGTLVIGKNFTIVSESTIIAFNKISFGDDCLLSWDILVMDTDMHEIKNEFGNVINSNKEISIGHHVWIGCRSLILKGSVVPDNCVIGANSHLFKPLSDSSCVYVGNPSKIAVKNIYWQNNY